MGIVFQNGRFVADKGQSNVQKATEETLILQRLRSFLDAEEPGLVRFLLNTWNAQGKAITYKELREAILAGDISMEYLKDWQKDYAKFVVKYMQPAWEKAIKVAAAETARKYPTWRFDPMGDAVREWTATRSAEFITNITDAQLQGLRAVIRKATVLEDMGVDDLARAIRPMVGLTKQQSVANLNYYHTLRANGTSPKKAQDLTLRYAARQQRHRAYTIARTEMASAYNAGAYEGTKQAQAAGYMGKTVKIWCTAEDERVCSICGGLENRRIDMDEEFEGMSRSWSTRLTPPAHPGCRCAVMYEEIEKPVI